MIKPRIKGYEILDTVGNGAGSLVFKAVHIPTQRLCAIKHVTRRTIDAIEQARRSARDGSARIGNHPRIPYGNFFDQVRNEYRVLRTLDANTHPPQIVRVHGLFPIRRFLRLFGYDLVMEFVDGVSLRDKRDYPMPELIRYFREAATALAYLHAHKILTPT